MFDDLSKTPPLGAQAAVGDRCSSRIAIWVRWRGDGASLVNALEPQCEMEGFRLSTPGPTETEPGVWMCWFDPAGLSPDLERRTEGLLRRLNKIAHWVRAERVFHRSSVEAEDVDAYLWDAFSRRPLP